MLKRVSVQAGDPVEGEPAEPADALKLPCPTGSQGDTITWGAAHFGWWASETSTPSAPRC